MSDNYLEVLKQIQSLSSSEDNVRKNKGNIISMIDTGLKELKDDNKAKLIDAINKIEGGYRRGGKYNMYGGSLEEIEKILKILIGFKVV